MAAVHVIIVGFSNSYAKFNKFIVSGNGEHKSIDNITPYLTEGNLVFIESRTKPICNVPLMCRGNQPTDGGNLIIENEDYLDFINKEPKAKKYIKALTGAAEFINQKDRYCLWLVNVSPAELKQMPLVIKRIEAVKQMRLASTFEPTRKLAERPTVFREQLNPESYILIPRVSSERRNYIPMGFLDKNTIPTDSVHIVPEAKIFHFGVLTSSVHMAWMRTVAGRLKSDYRYSKEIVYNNFPWPEPAEQQKEKIEQTAQAILDARAKYPESSLADLYDPLLMPADLRKAHKANDRAVMEAYGMWGKVHSEEECVAWLFRLYQELTEQ